MIAIFKKELKTYFYSWIGYIYLFFFVVITAFVFFSYNIQYMTPVYAITLNSTTIMMLFLIPILTMRIFSEEIKNKTDQLLFTSPVKISHIVLSKYCAAFLVFFIGFLITMIFPLIIYFTGSLPLKETIGAIAGYLFLGSSLISVGLFISSLTENQINAAIITFVVLFSFYIVGNISSSMPKDKLSSLIFLLLIYIILASSIYNSSKNFYATLVFIFVLIIITTAIYLVNSLIFDSLIYKTLSWFALLDRYNNFGMGIFVFSDMFYYLSFTFVFIFLTIKTLEKRRWK